ncbi:hypothetical protein ACU686_11675 [Yinghuangia aomiensis]
MVDAVGKAGGIAGPRRARPAVPCGSSGTRTAARRYPRRLDTGSKDRPHDLEFRRLPGQSSLDTHNRWASWGRWERFQKPEALAASFLGSGRAEALGERFAATKEDRAFQRKLAQRAGKDLSAAFDKRHRKPATTSSLRRQTEASTAREAAGRAAAQAQSGFYASDEAAIVRDFLGAMIDRYGARDRNAPGLDMLEYARGLVDTAHGELHASAAAKVHWAAAEAHENVYARLAASSADLAPAGNARGCRRRNTRKSAAAPRHRTS